MLAQSGDAGQTWSKPVKVVDEESDERGPSVTLLSNGLMICSFSTISSKGEGCSIVVSQDGGKSWSKSIKTSKSYFTSSPIVELSNGNLIMGMFFERLDGSDILEAHGAVSISPDKGVSWSGPTIIPSKAGFILDAETSILELDSGIVFSVLRTSDLAMNMHFSISRDYGLNWEESKDIGFPGHCPYLFRISKDSVMLAHRYPGTTLRFSANNCKSWSDAYIVSDATGAYPSIARINKNEYIIAFYDDGFLPHLNRGIIRFKKFRLSGHNLIWLNFDSSISNSF